MPRKPRSAECKARQAEAMRRYWVSLSTTEKAEVGQRISTALVGQIHGPERRKRNSEAQKGKTLSAVHKEKVSAGVRASYAEGKREPVRSSHRAGVGHSPAARDKISNSLKQSYKEGLEPWNKGKNTAPRSEDVRQRIALSLSGRSHPISPEKREAWRQAISHTKMGHVQSPETRMRRSFSLRRAYAEGRKVVSPRSGYGIGEFYESPFQGRIWLRSGSEVQRAKELDAGKAVWFYEARRYPVRVTTQETTYTPDFWVVLGVTRETVPEDALAFLAGLPVSAVHVEDVKGWWKPTHKTYPKIQAFREQYPDIQFNIVIREGRV